MKTRIFASLVLLMMVLTVSAVPAKPGQKKLLRLSDGTTVVAQLVGDENGHFWRSTDGRAFRKTKNGVVQISESDVVKKAQKRRTMKNQHRAKRMKAAQAPKRKAGGVGSYTGKKKGLIILVEYTDEKFQAGNDQTLFNRIANEENFVYEEFVGSVYDYFLAQSEGIFELNFDVVGPYTLKNDRAYYGGNDSEGSDLHPAGMVAEACQLADSDVDYKDYDWDGDGEVDQVYVLYAGAGEANGGDNDTVWPHEWQLSSAQYYGEDVAALHLDGVIIDTYACSNELQPADYDRNYNVTDWKIDGIGTICHEFSHCLGYPDFYDTNYQGPGMSYWDLMDGGSYNGESFCPAGYTSYERWVAGWKTPIELTEDTEVSAMEALQNGGDTYIIYNDGNRNEYFLLENRQFIAWDAEIPGEGLLILHVDYDDTAWERNSVNNVENHQRMTWIAADNDKPYDTYDGLRYYDFYDMANDTYPYKTNNSFTNTSTPAATLYNKNTDGSKKLNKSVLDITQNSDGTVSFRFLASVESVTPTGDGSYKRITSLGELKESVDYLIVYEASETEGTAYAGIDASKNIGKKADISISGYTTDGTSASPVRLKKASDDNWYILDGESYLYFDGSGNKLLASNTLGNRGYTWTISTSDITSVDFPNRKLQYNKNSNGLRFACYTGSQEDVVLYVKDDNTSSIDKPTMKSAKNEDIYTLQGIKIASADQNLKKGIYIVGGKKIVVK